MEWPALITEYERLLRELRSLSSPTTPFRERGSPASEESLASAEQSLGLKLDPIHRAFLGHANGWPEFSGAISLLSDAELLSSPQQAIGRKHLNSLSWSALGRYRWKRRALLIIAASDCTLDVVCMPVLGKLVQPSVIWINNVEPEEFQDFATYFKALLSYKPEAIRHFRSRQAGGSDA